MLGGAESPLEFCDDKVKEQLEWLHVIHQLRIAALGHGVGRELDMMKVGVLLGKYDRVGGRGVRELGRHMQRSGVILVLIHGILAG